ncbi:PAS domain S-box protein [Bacillus timonensis]|nr:PAS domain S-box protein [Bacillus timonensis]
MNSVTYSELEQLKSRISSLEAENEQLRLSRERHQVIFERALDAIIIFDKDANFMDMNEAACHLFNLTKSELRHRNLREFLSLVPSERVDAQLNVLEREGHGSAELLLKLDDGTEKYIEYSAKRNAFKNGLDLSIMRDITSRKVLEHERLVNEQMFKDVFDRAVDGIIIFDEDGNLIDVNTSFCRALETSKKDLLLSKIEDLVEPEYLYKLTKLKAILRDYGRAKGDLPIITKGGQQKLFEFTTTANIYNGFYMSILRDVTEKKNMEMQLRKSEERFRDIFEHALDAIVIWDECGKIVRANSSASRMFELPLEQLSKRNIFEFVDVDTQEKLNEIRVEFELKGQIRDELMFFMPNNEYKQLEFTSRKNVIEGFNMTIFRNVSERRKMEKDLREKEQKFRKIFDTAMDGIVLFDNDYLLLDANPVACNILGIDKTAIKNEYLSKLTSIKNATTQFHKHEENISEHPFIFKNGIEKILEFSYKKNIIPNVHMAIFRDITERKEMEEQLRKSDTLSVVGELAAGIAHEIRNPMTALKGFIHLLQGSVKEDFSMYFNVITTELMRIESIITEFLVLAKPQAIKYQQVDLDKIMKDTIELLSPQAILSNVQVKSKFGANLPSIYCEPNQLKQVFINILKNAIEVMPKGGIVDVSIARKDRDNLLISLTDQGGGIPKDKIKKLGEPFYTTKERGTGLGLMVSYKIIEEHKGNIVVESELGKGTTFYISLPIYQSKIEA